MGGPGSGNWYRFNKKDTVEECREIDIGRWHRQGLFGPEPRYSCWTWSRNGKEIASISAWTSHSEATLSYSYWRGTNEESKQGVEYTIPLSWTECNFGGKRPWFICPGIVNGRVCHRRVAKLYLRWGYFLCRHCHDLTYETRQVGRKYSALRKCQNIRQRLGGSPNMTEPFPPPPKGMHFRTYLRHRLEHDEAEQRYTAAMLVDLEKLDSQLSRLSKKDS